MKNSKKQFFFFILPLVFLLGVVYSCKEFLDTNPGDSLTPDQFYRDVNDADVAVRGIYGKLVNLAPQYVILNELRADLMDVTNNADYYYRQINLHQADSSNPYINARPFFSVINDCNDALKNFKIMLNELRLSENEFDQRYSDIGALRCWLYLQLVIHYGRVPYITEPVENIADLNKIT